MISSSVQALLSKASALRHAGRVEEAIAAYRQLLNVEPQLPDSWYNLGWLQRQARHFEEALASYAEALARGVSKPEEVHVNRAVILSDQLFRPDDARAELDRALALNPLYLPALLNLGNLAEDRGDRRGAEDAYRRALEVDPLSGLALARLAGVTMDYETDDLLRRVGERLDDPALELAGRADLGFAQGRLLDRAGRYSDAFAAYRSANDAVRASAGPSFKSYDAVAHERFVDRLISTFDRPTTARAEAEPVVFICGMFRSGSTLGEQILAAHSKVMPGGELDLIPTIAERISPYPEAAANDEAIAGARRNYLRGIETLDAGSRLITDKRPDNFLHIGLIKAMFPRARIVHTRRNALDNLLSLYFLQLHPDMSYALDLDDAAHWYGQYQRLMAHWERLFGEDIFTLDYDELVRDPTRVTEALLHFCGLEWEDACLQPHRVKGEVKTASVWQVREPVHRRSSGRWKNYADEMRELASRLGSDWPEKA